MKYLQVFLPLLLVGLFTLKVCRAQTSNTDATSSALPSSYYDTTSSNGTAKKVSGSLRYTAIRRISLNNPSSSSSTRNNNRRGNRRGNRRNNRSRNRNNRGNINVRVG
ncbi:uncharacterized protein DDB_G0286105-like [Anastrepha ludens]|uniref:uncharacterized protein DDB_G0286105-like n=1 Tax=Anastrepha ludens TaxID=28586 RepID=UPI0023B1E604|nr:uncharacterized protein DDB_G0286105-like [Anastrepha ludens]